VTVAGDQDDLGPWAADVERLLEAEHIDPSYVVFVARHLRRDDAGWRWCCGSSCDPCVEGLGRVVDATRRLLGICPPGLPKPADPT